MNRLQWKEYWRQKRLDAKPEIWKPVVGYEGRYEVSNLGNIKSFKKGKYMIIKQQFNKKGYKRLSLSFNGVTKSNLVHRLVADAFIPNPENKETINHINGIKDDNKLGNLEWNTKSENMQHAYDNGFKIAYLLGKFGKYCRNSKKVYQYTKSGEFIREWGSGIDIERELGIFNTNISQCCRGKLKTAGGFVWKNKN